MKRVLFVFAVATATLLGGTRQSFTQEGARYILQFSAGRSEAGRAALRAAGAQVVLSLDPQNAVAALIPE